MITVVGECPGVTSLQYEEACRLANISQSHFPDGLIFHSASQTESGLVIVDVWESEQQFVAAMASFAPIFEKLGIEVQPRIYPTLATILGRVPAQV